MMAHLTKALQREARLLAAAASLLTFTLGCGKEAGFSGSNGKKQGADLVPGNGLPPAGRFSALTWHWACLKDDAQAKDPVIADDKIDIFGGGDHPVPRQAVDNVPLTFKGELCKPEEMARDIVFVIDVSGSMGADFGSTGNDPLTANNTCGRLDAIRRVVAAYQGTEARFSIVTFNDRRMAMSTNFFSTEAQLLADIAPNGKPESVLCAHSGGTIYSAGLTASNDLLSRGREHATKEIYFVSDGEPNDAEPTIKTQADTLKNTGVKIGATTTKVTIATIMLRGASDAVLRNSMASLDSQGNPLHERAENAAKLAEILDKLANNEIVSATISLRAAGSSDWTTVDIMPHQTNLEFELPSHLIDAANSPNGIEVMYRYVDASGKESVSTGRLVWEAEK